MMGSLALSVQLIPCWMDGAIFALSTGNKNADVTTVGTFAAEAISMAIIRAVKMAASAGGLPGLAGIS
jgi:hypothetical protein